MTKDPVSVSPDITIKEFVDKYVYQSYHHLYPVAENGALMGYISLKEVKFLPKEKWSKTTVEETMVPHDKFKTVSSTSNALEALELMQHTDTSTLLVVDGRRLVGMLTAQNLFKVISLKLELQEPDRKF